MPLYAGWQSLELQELGSTPDLIMMVTILGHKLEVVVPATPPDWSRFEEFAIAFSLNTSSVSRLLDF